MSKNAASILHLATNEGDEIGDDSSIDLNDPLVEDAALTIQSK